MWLAEWLYNVPGRMAVQYDWPYGCIMCLAVWLYNVPGRMAVIIYFPVTPIHFCRCWNITHSQSARILRLTLDNTRHSLEYSLNSLNSYCLVPLDIRYLHGRRLELCYKSNKAHECSDVTMSFPYRNRNRQAVLRPSADTFLSISQGFTCGQGDVTVIV